MSATKQPVWKFIANLGDANPLEYSGLFVFIDETGVYSPEAKRLLSPEYSGKTDIWELRTFTLTPCILDPMGFISDNKYHPHYPAWFGKVKELESVASFQGLKMETLRSMFLSNDICERARAYEAIGNYYGWDNLDEYPLYLCRDQAKAVVKLTK